MSLDNLINEHEKRAQHVDCGVCEFRLGRGSPLSKVRCPMCISLSSIIDLSSSWIQRIDSGRLIGRSIEIAEIPNIRNIRDADAAWRIYVECDNAQRSVMQSLLRRYYASFTCNGDHYTLREVTYSATPPLDNMMAQLIELFSVPGALPVNFVHGNPTVASIKFSSRLPVALRYRNAPPSRYLLQLDYGGIDSAVLTATARQGIVRETLGAIVFDPDKKTLMIRKEATFLSFLTEYPRYSKEIALQLLLRGLLSLYPSREWALNKEIMAMCPNGCSKAINLKEAFEEMRGQPFPVVTLPTG